MQYWDLKLETKIETSQRAKGKKRFTPRKQSTEEEARKEEERVDRQQKNRRCSSINAEERRLALALHKMRTTVEFGCCHFCGEHNQIMDTKHIICQLIKPIMENCRK